MEWFQHSRLCRYVLDPDTGSDHSAIRLKIKCPQKPHQNSNDLTHIKKIKWNEDTKLLFEIKMKSSETTNQINKINLMLDHDASIEDIVKEFTNIITPKTGRKSKKNHPKKQKPKKWYDYSCFEMSKRLKNVAKLYAKNPTNPHIRASLCKTRKDYRKLMKQKKREWTNNLISKLEETEAKIQRNIGK